MVCEREGGGYNTHFTVRERQRDREKDREGEREIERGSPQPLSSFADRHTYTQTYTHGHKPGKVSVCLCVQTPLSPPCPSFPYLPSPS